MAPQGCSRIFPEVYYPLEDLTGKMWLGEKRLHPLWAGELAESGRGSISCEPGEQKAHSSDNAFHEKAGLCQLVFRFAVVLL